MKRKIRVVSVVLALALSLSWIAGCAGGAPGAAPTVTRTVTETVSPAETPTVTPTGEPIKIGILTPLSGIVAQGGKEIGMGIEMAAEDKGSLLGHPIETIKEDTAVKPAQAVSKAEKLVFKDKVVALIGVFSSGVGLALADNIERLGVPFVSTHVMTTKFYGLHDYVFRSGQLANDQTARANVMGILSTPKLRDLSYYVLVQDYAWGYDAAQRFIDLARANDIKLVPAPGGKSYNGFTYATVPIPTKDFSSFITRIKASEADAVYSALITGVTCNFVKQAREFGVDVPVVSGALPGIQSLEAAGEKATGLLAAGDWSWDVDNRISNSWEKRFYDTYDLIPSDAACHSYVGAMNLFRAIERAGSTEPNRIAAALKGVSHEGPYGRVRISALDNCMRNDAFLFEARPAPDNPYGAKMSLKVIHRFPWQTIQRGTLELVNRKLELKPYKKLTPIK